jgi:hypothetical protein
VQFRQLAESASAPRTGKCDSLKATLHFPRNPVPLQPFSGSTILRFDDFPNFPRNGPPDSTQYISEWPEMTASKQGLKEGHNKKRKLNHE